MSAVNIIFGAYPHADPGRSGLWHRAVYQLAQGEALLSLTSDVSGAIDDNGCCAGTALVPGNWPVSALRQPDIVLAGSQPRDFPLETARRPNRRSVARTASCFSRQRARRTTACTRLRPESTDVATRHQRCSAVPPTQWALRCRGDAAPLRQPRCRELPASIRRRSPLRVYRFPGPFGSHRPWGRTLRYVFATMWDGGVLSSSPASDRRAETAERDHHVGGRQHGRRPQGVPGEVTAISHTVVSATANTVASVSSALGVPFSFQQGQEFVDGVAELATALDVNYSF